ncbi:MAG TPA: hypothetical protein VGS79_20600 [Puia sp.]|nr:hypothetical protein [Puia sp.]
MPSTYASAQANGIVSGGTDQTSAINAILANPAYTGMILDVGGAITINGTVTGGGKTIQYQAGNHFTGGGTISGHQIDAGYQQTIFDTSIILTGCTTASNMFSALWFAAGVSPTGDYAPAFQTAINAVIANNTSGSGMTRDLYFPPGSYSIGSPLILYRWNGTAYSQFTINLIGDYSPQYANGTGCAVLLPTFSDTFAIGVQRATGGMIRGLYIQGPFATNSFFNTLTFDAFVQTSFDSITGHPRDSANSPNAGIVIDPFTNGPLPPDGGWPTLNGSIPGDLNWYRGDGSNGGTSGFQIYMCYIAGFTVDICNSPNAYTQQGEDCLIQDCQLNICNVAVSYGQFQSDNCYIENIRCWYWVWTVVDNIIYGKGNNPVMANINRMNIAGSVNTIFNVGSLKGFSIQNVYAESFFSIGSITAHIAAGVISGSTFDFALSATNLQPALHLTCYNVEINSCTLRYYDGLYNKRLRIAGGNMRFINCYFDLPPYLANGSAQGNVAKYENCNVAGSMVLGMNTDMYFMSAAANTPVVYGDFKIQDGWGIEAGFTRYPTATYSYSCPNFNRLFGGFADSVEITPDSDRSATFTGIGIIAQVNDILISDTTKQMIGRISAISGNTITISEIPINITAGSYTLDLVYFLTAANPIVGDITNGSTSITNVCPLFTGYINSLGAGFRFDHPAFTNGTYIVSYDSATRVLTMSTASNITAVRQNFVNGNPSIEVRSMDAANDADISNYPTPFAAGTRWIEIPSLISTTKTTPNVWVFNRGGYLNAAALGLSSAYQADYNLEPLIRNNGGTIQYFDTVSGTWINV